MCTQRTCNTLFYCHLCLQLMVCYAAHTQSFIIKLALAFIWPEHLCNRLCSTTCSSARGFITTRFTESLHISTGLKVSLNGPKGDFQTHRYLIL